MIRIRAQGYSIFAWFGDSGWLYVDIHTAGRTLKNKFDPKNHQGIDDALSAIRRFQQYGGCPHELHEEIFVLSLPTVNIEDGTK